MKNNNHIIKNNYVLICIIIILITMIIVKNDNLKLQSYTFTNNTPHTINIRKSAHPIITIICGVHGNEYAPSIGCQQFINENNFKKGNLFFIPRVNKEGLKTENRYLPSKSNFLFKYDINRKFGKDDNKLINSITNIVDKSDFVLDFHEAYRFHVSDKGPYKSMGSTISSTLNNDSIHIAKHLINDINSTITDNNKKFIYLDDKKYNIPYSLGDYCNKKKINYNLVEITGINNAQPLELRVSQTKYLLNSLFVYFNLL